jgi:hypothetical protein
MCEWVYIGQAPAEKLKMHEQASQVVGDAECHHGHRQVLKQRYGAE